MTKTGLGGGVAVGEAVGGAVAAVGAAEFVVAAPAGVAASAPGVDGVARATADSVGAPACGAVVPGPRSRSAPAWLWWLERWSRPAWRWAARAPRA